MKVAVVGSGVSGLAATWLLNEYSDHEVHLYESDSRPGGHANTILFRQKGQSEDEGVFVDTGFIVFNPSTYPNFLRFLRLYPPTPEGQGIKILPTEMTFSVSRDMGLFEWAGKNLLTVFCQPRRLLDPHMWRMLYDVFRFNVSARRVLIESENKERNISIGEYLLKEGYSDAFRINYLIPMTAAIWSTPPDKCFLEFPARTLIQFLYNHHLLQVVGKPSWLTIEGGSHHYVKKILDKLPKEQLHLSTPVTSVKTAKVEFNGKPQVVLSTAGGKDVAYDHVIFACHSDTALEVLRKGNITDEEDRILSQFDWNQNEAVLHHDIRLMPKSRAAWSSWNYLTFSDGQQNEVGAQRRPTAPSQQSVKDINQVSLTYSMNELQHISENIYGPVLVTLNPPFSPDQDKVVGSWKYEHPILDAKAVAAQNEMHKIQSTRSISYAGAYLKYGFHEDGFTSGLLAACAVDVGADPAPSNSSASLLGLESMEIPIRNLTVRPPFSIEHPDRHIHLSRKRSGGIGYEAAAHMFTFLEGSGLRMLVGAIGSLLLGALRWLFVDKEQSTIDKSE